jgi:hypothetical protein
MNLFVLDEDPTVAAQLACDKHVIKMTLETAQMLSTIAHAHGAGQFAYKPTHAKHPCTIWVGQSQENFEWAYYHGLALGREYTLRYGKTHKSELVIRRLQPLIQMLPRIGKLSPFAQAMPPEYKHPCAVTAYRRFYQGEKAKFAKWSAPRSRPAWMDTEISL